MVGMAMTLMGLSMAVSGATTTEYVSGSLSGEEQYLLELLNRTRSAPTAEAQRFRDMTDPAKTPAAALDWDVKDAYTYFGVNLSLMQSQYATVAAAPPLAPNAKLMAMARSHTEWMFANRMERHAELPTETDSQSILRRFQATGYQVQTGGENIYAYARSVMHAHVGFEVDWGTGTGGMQNPPYHRNSNHKAEYREVGVGVKKGLTGYTWDDVGPYLGTVDLAVEHNSGVFVTGVAYSDLNGNGLYDVGEGVGGLRVDVSGASYHAVTSAGGGYAVPVPATGGTYTVTFSGLNCDHATTVTVPAGKNVKVDYVAPHAAPAVAVENPVYIGTPLAAEVAAPVGATGIDWSVGTKVAAAPFDCNSGNGVTYSIVPVASYPLTISVNGRVAWHLAHPQAEFQWIQLSPRYLPGSGASLTFQSRLAAANERQVARVQVSTDDGGTWTDVWNKTGGTAATAFAPVTVPLTAYAGHLVRIRFAYSMGGDYWVNSTGNTSGWFIDDVAFSGVSQLSEIASGQQPVDGPTVRLLWTPLTVGSYVVAARPEISGRAWPWAPVTEFDATAASGFVSWAQSVEATLGLSPGSVANDPAVDPSGGTIPGIVRYALGIGPTESNSARLPVVTPEGGRLVFTYQCDPARTDVSISVELSEDFIRWMPAGSSGSPGSVAETVVSTSGGVETRRVVVVPAHDRIGARLKVVR